MSPRALVIAVLVLSANTARADLVTPDSITPAPGWVTDQYKQLGLVFTPQYNDPSSSLWLGPWWAGTYNEARGWVSDAAQWNRGPDGQAFGPPVLGVPTGIQSISFVMPGTGAPATSDSIRVHAYSFSDAVVTLQGYDSAGNQIVSRDVLVSGNSDNWLTLQGARMHSFDILSNWPPDSGISENWPPIPIEGIEFRPVPALPEPSGLVLSGLGALALILARRYQAYRVRRLGVTRSRDQGPHYS
jgi:hypothetical protein